jgi:hypothetical protein
LIAKELSFLATTKSLQEYEMAGLVFACRAARIEKLRMQVGVAGRKGLGKDD